MPVKKVTANTTAQTITTVEKHKKCKITAINVDNQHSADLTLTLLDTFTPDSSHGVSSPSAKEIEKWVQTVGTGTTASFDKNELEGLECLGTVKMKASDTSTSCVIVVHYQWT